MDNQTAQDELVNFFKSLADENRLKIIGLLSKQSHTVGQMAKLLGVSLSTTSHHLAKLSKAGLVSARTDGHYYIYSLELSKLQEMAKRLLCESEMREFSQDPSLNTYDQKVMDSFITEDGRINAFPAQEKKFLVLLRYVLKAFKPGLRYPEKQVNEILSRYNDDTAMLRRSLVEYKYMRRAGGGGEYWVNEEMGMD